MPVFAYVMSKSLMTDSIWLAMTCGRNVKNRLHAQRVLGSDGRDGYRAMYAKRLKSLYIGFNAGASAGVGARDR